MKFSESWLRELANPDLNCDALIAQLTMAGLEIDGVEAAANFDGVVVARIESLAASIAAAAILCRSSAVRPMLAKVW